MTTSLITCAQDAPPPGLYAALTGEDVSKQLGLAAWQLSAGGWAALGYSYNANDPQDRSNGPVQFNNRANEFNLYQLGLYIEKQLVRDTHQWSLGGRVEFMYGTDTPNTQATGHWDDGLISENAYRFYDIAIPQAYLEIYTPNGNGLSTKIGHFYSILGYESVPATPNFFVSHSYSMKSSPFTMTGVLSSYPLTETFSLMAGAVSGADNFDSHFGAWSFIGGFNWNSSDNQRGFTFSLLDGDVDDTQPSRLIYYYSAFRQDLSQQLHYVLQHDRGTQQNALHGRNSAWYSIVQYLTYDLNPNWKLGLRAEWFRDDAGTRFNYGPASYYAVSGGVNWKPFAWLLMRPEIRYDWADSQQKPFDTGNRRDQLLLSFDAVITF